MSIATVGEENPQEATAGRAVATGSRAAGQGTRRRQIRQGHRGGPRGSVPGPQELGVRPQPPEEVAFQL